MDFAGLQRGFAANVRKARHLAGLTQEQVAARGISLRHFAEIERGEANPTLEVLARLAKILSTTPASLVDLAGGAACQPTIVAAKGDSAATRAKATRAARRCRPARQNE